MGRQRVFKNDAERQRAYRKRLAAKMNGNVAVIPVVKRRRAPSRPKRLAAVIREVQDLHQEYEHWFESFPEPLRESEQADRLAEVIGQLESVIDLLSDISPPKGFGRD